MSVKQITTDDLRRMKGTECLILQGCGGSLDEWVDGINDVLSFTETTDGTSVVVKREKLCNNCKQNQPPSKSDEVTLFDFLNNLSPEQQRAALVHLSVRWAEKQNLQQGGELNV